MLWLDVAGIGLTLLATLAGLLVLIVPGRLRPAEASALGLGRHVEALLILTFVLQLRISVGQLPVHVSERGVLLVSFTGAIIPTVLSLRFLVRARARGAAMLLGVAAAAWVSFLVSRTIPELGIASEFPYYFLPALVAAGAAHLTAPGRLQAVPLAYAAGSLGGFIGADLVRLDWVVREATSMGASFGGAGAMDLVAQMGLWGAAFAGLPVIARWDRTRQAGPWDDVYARLEAGQTRSALETARALAEETLTTWSLRRGLAAAPRTELLRASYAAPVFALADAAEAPGASPLDVKRALEALEGLARRLLTEPTAPPAHAGRRVVAGLIDALVPLTAAFVAVALVASGTMRALEGETPQQTAARSLGLKIYFVLATTVAVHILYPLLLEAATRGRTLGKWMLGLRVVRNDGSPIGAWDATVRNLARLLDLSLLYVVAFVAPADRGRQRLGDYFAQTVVVRNVKTTQPALATAPTTMPPSAQPQAPATSALPR